MIMLFGSLVRHRRLARIMTSYIQEYANPFGYESKILWEYKLILFKKRQSLRGQPTFQLVFKRVVHHCFRLYHIRSCLSICINEMLVRATSVIWVLFCQYTFVHSLSNIFAFWRINATTSNALVFIFYH